MESLDLIEPNINFENEYQEMLDDWRRTKEKLIPFVLQGKVIS